MSNTKDISKIGKSLQTNKFFQIAEILMLFMVAFIFIKAILPLFNNSPVSRQLILWGANIIMLLYIWIGIKLRGSEGQHFGLSLIPKTSKNWIKFFLLSILVFTIALAGFMFGSMIMTNISGIPTGTNLTSYDYLKDNIPMLALTLIGVYTASSFGEEVIYRGFLITRISKIGNNTKLASTIAVILSSLIFGLIHFDWGVFGIVQTGFMGLALGICYLKLKRRLWILILAHAYMDTILILQIYLASN